MLCIMFMFFDLPRPPDRTMTAGAAIYQGISRESCLGHLEIRCHTMFFDLPRPPEATFYIMLCIMFLMIIGRAMFFDLPPAGVTVVCFSAWPS